MKIFLLRHAQSESNALGRMASEDDEPLTIVGMDQARNIVPELKELNISKILCSTYLRVRQTIEPFINEVSIDVQYSELLAEGELVLGRRKDRIVDERKNDLTDNAENFLTRAALAFELIKEQRQHSVLVVSHGHMIREMINLFLDLPHTVRFPHENCSLSLIELNEHIRVEYLNRPLGY